MFCAVDVQDLHRLMNHWNLPKRINSIRIYFRDTTAKGITAQNQLIARATASLSDLMGEHTEHREEANDNLQLFDRAEDGGIKKQGCAPLAIPKDMKKDIDDGKQPGEVVIAAMFQTMPDIPAEQKQAFRTMDKLIRWESAYRLMGKPPTNLRKKMVGQAGKKTN